MGILSIFVDFCVLPLLKTLIPCYKTFINLLDSMLKLANSSFFYPTVFIHLFFYPTVFIHIFFYPTTFFFISPFLSTKQLFICLFYPLFLSKSKTYPRFLALFLSTKMFLSNLGLSTSLLLISNSASHCFSVSHQE